MNIEIIMLFLLVIVLLIFLLPRTEEDGKERAGKEGEILAGKMIQQYLNEQDILFNNVEIVVHGRETELDYVVINKNGVFIFEVKNYSGELEGNEDDEYWNKYKISSGNNEYVKEVRNPINYGIDLWINGYVLFVNMNSPIDSDYTINNERELNSILHTRGGQTLNKKQIEKIVNILK